MNLNQSAHGDIEFGHICTRMRIPRKVVVGYWKSGMDATVDDPDSHQKADVLVCDLPCSGLGVM